MYVYIYIYIHKTLTHTKEHKSIKELKEYKRANTYIYYMSYLVEFWH